MRRLAVLAVAALSAAATGCASSSSSDPIPQPATVNATRTVRVSQPQGVTAITLVSAISPGVAQVAAPIDTVWRVMPAVYDSLGIAIDRLDHAQRVIGNPSFKVRRRLGGVPLTRFFDCGRAQGGPSAETYELTMTVLSELQSGTPGLTTATTTVRATARPVSFVGEGVVCSSTGKLEERIGDLIAAFLRP